jgi:hypothetical protein
MESDNVPAVRHDLLLQSFLKERKLIGVSAIDSTAERPFLFDSSKFEPRRNSDVDCYGLVLVKTRDVLQGPNQPGEEVVDGGFFLLHRRLLRQTGFWSQGFLQMSCKFWYRQYLEASCQRAWCCPTQECANQFSNRAIKQNDNGTVWETRSDQAAIFATALVQGLSAV